jgi:hypothetical protein
MVSCQNVWGPQNKFRAAKAKINFENVDSIGSRSTAGTNPDPMGSLPLSWISVFGIAVILDRICLLMHNVH